MDAAFKGRIPDSVLPFPDGLWNQVKYVFWKAITPGYLWGLNLLLDLHILHHEGRQNFVLGKLASGRKMEDFIQYLHFKGYFNHFIAWEDDGQIISLRKLENFEWQYHLRVFKDGEVRGHYEYTPESHPKLHLKEIGMEERREVFLNNLGDWITPVKQEK
jgi:hypothetical protein